MKLEEEMIKERKMIRDTEIIWNDEDLGGDDVKMKKATMKLMIGMLMIFEMMMMMMSILEM